MLQAAAISSTAAVLPCLAAAVCFSPDSPRFLLWRDQKTRCVEALQWLRGQFADIGTEFSRLSDTLSVGQVGCTVLYCGVVQVLLYCTVG